jgi:hypothetical protein
MSLSSLPGTASAENSSEPPSFMSKATSKDQTWKKVWDGGSAQLSRDRIIKISAGYKDGEARWEMTIETRWATSVKKYAESNNLMVFHQAIGFSHDPLPTQLTADEQPAARRFIDDFRGLDPWAT